MIINYKICMVFVLFNYNYNKRHALLKWKRNSKQFFLFYWKHVLFVKTMSFSFCYWFNMVLKTKCKFNNNSGQEKRKKPVVINLIFFYSMILIVFKLMDFIEKFKYLNICVRILNWALNLIWNAFWHK